MYHNPHISICMVFYNAEPYIKEAIDSALKQSFENFEFVIVDDGSTDGSSDIVKSYTDKRIKYFKNRHNYIDSLNKACKTATGKYIARMDADDIMMPNRLQAQYDFMELYPEIDICGTWAQEFGSRTNIIRLHTEHREIASSLLLYNTMAHPTVMLRKSTVCKDGNDLYRHGYDCAEDYKLWTELAIKGLRFANIPEVLLKYRVSESQVTSVRRKEMLQSSHKIQMEYVELVMQQIIQQDESYFDIFNSLIVLSNEKRIDSKQMLNIVYQLYQSQHDKKKN